MEYFKAFITGSAYPVTLPFLARVSQLENKNYSYELYSLVAPLYLGLMNALSLLLAKDLRTRLLLMGVISPIPVMIFATLTESYNFSQREWYWYYLRLFIKHFLTYNVNMYLMTKLFE